MVILTLESSCVGTVPWFGHRQVLFDVLAEVRLLFKYTCLGRVRKRQQTCSKSLDCAGQRILFNGRWSLERGYWLVSVWLVTVNQVSTSDDGPWGNKHVGMTEFLCTSTRKMTKRAEKRWKRGGENHRPKRRQKKKKKKVGEIPACPFAVSVIPDR